MQKEAHIRESIISLIKDCLVGCGPKTLGKNGIAAWFLPRMMSYNEWRIEVESPYWSHELIKRLRQKTAELGKDLNIAIKIVERPAALGEHRRSDIC